MHVFWYFSWSRWKKLQQGKNNLHSIYNRSAQLVLQSQVAKNWRAIICYCYPSMYMYVHMYVYVIYVTNFVCFCNAWTFQYTNSSMTETCQEGTHRQLESSTRHFGGFEDAYRQVCGWEIMRMSEWPNSPCEGSWCVPVDRMKLTIPSGRLISNATEDLICRD